MPDFPVTEDFVKTVNAVQLHDEARGNLVKWPASFTYVDGSWIYRVQRDDIDAVKVRAALDAHAPDPNYGLPAEVLTLRQFVAKASPTGTETTAALKALIKVQRP